jgi:hypothetical protein
VALVVEGGGMRGVVSSGMTAALEQLGLGRCSISSWAPGAFANSTCWARTATLAAITPKCRVVEILGPQGFSEWS